VDKIAKGADACSTVRSAKGSKRDKREEEKRQHSKPAFRASAHTGTTCPITHAGTPCLPVHAGTPCLTACTSFPSLPPPKARRPDEPQKRPGKGKAEGLGGGECVAKKFGHVGCRLGGQSDGKRMVGGIKEW